MAWNHIVAKDSTEHGPALLLLTLAALGVFALSLIRQNASEFSMSSFQVVHFALLSYLPLIAVILGNRLIVREYSGGTRRFMESLPIAPATPLIVKFFSGWLYLLGVAVALIGLAALFADPAEYFDSRYLALLLCKSAAVLSVIWSLVFFASLSGKFRLLIYLIIIVALIYLIYLPGFDENRLPPVALMDSELFALERELFPWRNIGLSVLIATAVSAAGFALALVNEGSVAEQLGQPISKRNLIAMTVLLSAIIVTATSLREKWATAPATFGARQVLKLDTPSIEVSHLSNAHRAQAQTILDTLQTTLTQFQQDTGVSALPTLQIALNTDLDPRLINSEFADAVLVTANYADYNRFEHTMLNTVALHHLMLILSNSRWDFESRHWILDGLSRWWAEGGPAAPQSPHRAEYLARALIAKRKFEPGYNPLLAWQTTTDQHGFEAAFALAYSALVYLAEQHRPAAVNALAKSYINEQPASSSVESIKSLFKTDVSRFEQITGLPIARFTADWLDWLERSSDEPAIRQLLRAVPAIDGDLQSTIDSHGVRWLEASYRRLPGYNGEIAGYCVLRHKQTSAYDLEEAIFNSEHDRQRCASGAAVHRIESPYAAGSRAYAILEYEADEYQWPIQLWAGRVTIK